MTHTTQSHARASVVCDTCMESTLAPGSRDVRENELFAYA